MTTKRVTEKKKEFARIYKENIHLSRKEIANIAGITQTSITKYIYDCEYLMLLTEEEVNATLSHKRKNGDTADFAIDERAKITVVNFGTFKLIPLYFLPKEIHWSRRFGRIIRKNIQRKTYEISYIGGICEVCMFTGVKR
ncbi:MAG: hypothetical protein LBV67_06200 [Streptococcaceae bacterium]|jgi:hypothetical protein|nr:hypothetical protein [Streptococcaceae bacterium]